MPIESLIPGPRGILRFNRGGTCSSRGLSIIDVIGRGTVARALLGIVVGFGLGYAIEHRILVAEAPKGARNRSKGGERSGGTSALLTVGFGAVLLALASPHLDRWLSRLTSFKSPIIELQLGSVASHKVSVTEGAAALNNVASLKNLSTYARAINQDIEFAQDYDRSNQAQSGTSRELLPAFTYLISPIAGCMQTAIDNGLSISSARQMLRPMTDNLALLVFNENNPKSRSKKIVFMSKGLA